MTRRAVIVTGAEDATTAHAPGDAFATTGAARANDA